MIQKNSPKSARVRRAAFTPLGKIYYEAEPWKRLKIETEIVSELGLKKWSHRAYMVTTPAYRMRADMQKIILGTLPEAKDCFIDPRVTKQEPV